MAKLDWLFLKAVARAVTITGSYFISSNTTVLFEAVPGTDVVDVTFTTPFGTTQIILDDQYTYIPAPPEAPLPLSYFIGIIKKHGCFKCNCFFEARFGASPSTEVVAYRIYKNNHLV